MLFKKLIVFAFISFFVSTPFATAIENGKSTKFKKDHEFLENKCNYPNTVGDKKANKYFDSQAIKPLNPNYISRLESSPKELIDEVWQIVYQEYVDPDFNQVDWLALRGKHLQKSYQDYSQAYTDIKKMLSLLEDPYTKFLTPEEFVELTRPRKQSSIGINLAQSSIPIMREKSEERFKALGKKTALSSSTELTNSKYRLEKSTISQRSTATNAPSVSSEIKDLDSRKISYIRLARFDNSAANQIREAIKDAESQQVGGYVLDLRSNPGGLLLSTIEIARMFLQQGTIVNILARSEMENKRYDAANKALTDTPLIVLVNAQSASGTEILASALKENNRATLIGEKTFGQGSIQSVRSLSNDFGLAVTIARFLTANCNKIEGIGIKPDILVKPTSSELSRLASNSSLLGSSDDSAYNRALEVLRSQF